MIQLNNGAFRIVPNNEVYEVRIGDSYPDTGFKEDMKDKVLLMFTVEVEDGVYIQLDGELFEGHPLSIEDIELLHGLHITALVEIVKQLDVSPDSDVTIALYDPEHHAVASDLPRVNHYLSKSRQELIRLWGSDHPGTNMDLAIGLVRHEHNERMADMFRGLGFDCSNLGAYEPMVHGKVSSIIEYMV